MMGSKLRKVQSDADKEQDAEENTRVQLEEPHISEEQHSKLITPTEPKKREHFVSFPGELSTNTDNETLPEQLIKLDNENKHQGYRIAELEAYILKLQGSESLAEPEFKGNKAVDNQQILEEKLRECEVMLEDRTDESKTLRKKLNEMELSYHQLQFECDALKGKLASVRELESLDSLSSEDESEVKHSAKAELLQRVKSLEGLLKIQEMSEKELTETVKELQGELLRSQENQRLLGLRCDKLDQLTKEKEDVESKLEERYSQVEQLQKEKEKSEEDYQEQIKMLIDEIKERDEAHSQLEAIYKDLLLKVGEMEESKTSLESKVAKFKMDLEERVDNELKLKKQCSDLEKTIRDWENFEQQLKEQFKRVESKQNGKIKSLRKQLEEKDETLKKTLQVVEELKKSIKDAESQLHERQHIAPEILKEKKQLEAELSRKADAEIDKAGFIVKMRSRFEMEVNEKSKELEDCKDEIECLNEEIGQLREQHWQQKEAERKLQERTKMLEELVEETKEGETKVLQEKIARMEKLISMKEETVETLQARIGKQETLLKEMEETERRLAQRNEELGVKQRGMSEELHCWRTKCSNLEKFEREVKFETKCQRDKIKDLEITKTNLEVQLQKKISEFEELGLLKKKELANVTAELNKKIEELEFKESVCRAAKQNVEMQLKKRMKEFEISEANVKNLQRKLEEALEEKQSGIRNVETTMRQEKAALEAELAKWSQSVISLETMIKEESQISLNLKGQLHTKEAALKMLQEEHSVLLVRIQGLEQDLEETKKDGTKRTEWENNKREMDVLNQRLEELTQSEEILKQTIDNFTKTEAALQRRIQDLELSEQRLLDKINELTSKSQQSMTSDPQLTGKLRSLQISEKDLKFLLAEKEKSEELLKGKLWRLQNQLRMKEDEMKNQSEYFEHYKQKQQQQMVKLREREQFLHSQIFKLDRERIDLNATSIILKTELQQVTAKFTKLEKVQSKRSKELSEHDIELANVARSVSEREDQVKDSILVLQDDLNKLLAKEEAINREKEQLRERLQQAEDNEDFLTHKLEDFRSRIHELKLSESSLQEQAEELEEENEKLRTELKQIQENENYLKEVLEEKEKLERLVEEKNKLHNMTLNNSELQLSSDEMPIHETSLEVTSKRLSNFCSAMFQNVDEETSPNRYRDLKNSLTHLRSQLQNGDILFREELLQSKWAAVLDSARNKNTQTPSIGQCVQEALIIAKLASESVCDYPKLSTAVKEGRIIPFLEANSCLLADLMQVLRTGDVEKVRAILQSRETQKELAMLLDHEEGDLLHCAPSPPLAEKQEINETAHVIKKCENYQAIGKELYSNAFVHVVNTNDESQSDQLDFELESPKVMSAELTCSSVQKTVEFTESDTNTCIPSKTHFSIKGDLADIDPKVLTETIRKLEAKIQQLQTEKMDMGQHLQCTNSQLLHVSEEKSKLADELHLANSEVNQLSQKLEEITEEKIQEKESMKNNLRKENEVLEKRNKELLNGIAKLESNQRELEADFKEKNGECLQRLSKLKEEKSKLEDTISCMRKENAQKSAECNQTIENLSTQTEQLKDRVSELESEYKTLANTVTRLKQEKGELMKENEHLLKNINQLENEKAQIIHQTVHHLTEENENLLAQVRKLESEVETYFMESSVAQNKINYLENENTNLINLKECLVKELKAQGTGEITKQHELKQQNNNLVQDVTFKKDDSKMMNKTERICEVQQNMNLREQNDELNDGLAESSTVNPMGGSNDYQSLRCKINAKGQNYLAEETGTVMETCLEENAIANDVAFEVINYSDKIKLLESTVKEKDQSLKKLKLDYDILQRKLMDIEEKSATGDIKLKHEGQVLQGKQSLAKKPVTEMLQLTLIERNNALEKLLEKTEMELKLKQEELDKTKTEAQKWHREVVSAESSAEKVQVDLTEVLSEVERLRKTVREQGRLKESDVELALRRENFQLKDQLTALNERNRNMDNLKARCSVMKKEFEELGRKKTEAELLIAPLKAKLSCLIQKCHRRNSLIIQLVRELYRHGFTNTGLIEEAEDMLNDTAILEYTRTFLSLGNQQGNMNTNSVPAGTPQQEQGLNHWFPSSLFHERQALLDSSAALTYRPHVAIADYRPYSNMPHTVLPVLPLSVGDVVLVSGDPDRHGMYVAEVNGELGLVPARFVEETNSILHLHTTRNKPTAGYRKNSPERITTLCQLPQHTQGNNDQVAPSVINSDADYNLLSIPCLSHKDVPQPFVSRSHDNLEDINFEACGKTTGQGQEEEHLFKSAEQFHYAPGDCCEISYGWACNDRGNQKSILSAGENTSSAALPEMATRSNLSERLATTLQGHTIKHRAAANWHDGKTSKMTQEPPAPVTSLHINGPIGQNSLLIEWEKPVLDENGCSNGTFIQGYRIFIDGEFYKSTMGSACTKILLEDLDLSVPFQVSIQTVGANGLVSEKLTVLFLNCQLREKPLSVQPLPSLTDQSNKSSEMLQFLAVYDYNPLQDSPNIHPSHELAFKEGDIICLYGKQRKDGFCEAEVNGRRGLVPTSFLGARIELPKTLEHKASRSASSPPGHHGTPEIPQSSEDICKQKLNNRQRLMRRI
ncbi:centromere-associated protein E-like isoform X2 [Rhincodon typus]|uniref:centromere-associated protein E-like isoform X2 n=1 Tax=Rhincodon typus TaxID=259920 RepID=UPI00203070C4|nr:centromere-associated protein E-like isoform X2 [Rhincodon typus]